MREFKLLAAVFSLVLALAGTAMAATVKVSVNGTDLTDIQISARAGLMRAERKGSSNSDRLQLATDELIDEALMLQEAARLGITVTDAQVDSALLNIARSNKVSVTILTKLLTESGVDPDTLKERLRANIAWQQVTQGVLGARLNISDLELEEKAREQIKDSNSYDYILKEVRFIIPQGSKTSSSQRTAQANQYRKSFQGCDSAVELSLSYTDAAVIDIGRRHATQLPEAIANELAGLPVGGITKPRVVSGGVSMLAVCSKSYAEDTTFIKQSLRQEVGTEKLKSEADDYLQSLRDKAVIVRK